MIPDERCRLRQEKAKGIFPSTQKIEQGVGGIQKRGAYSPPFFGQSPVERVKIDHVA